MNFCSTVALRLERKWWAVSMECYCYLRNVQDLLADGKTPHERRFGEPFGGAVIPCGSMVEYHPFLPKDILRLHQFGPEVLGDIWVKDIEELENLDESEIHARRLNAKEEVIMPKDGSNFFFPIADGTMKLSGRDQVFRKSNLIRDYPERGEEHKNDLQGESDGSRKLDKITDDGEVRNDFWSIASSRFVFVFVFSVLTSETSWLKKKQTKITFQKCQSDRPDATSAARIPGKVNLSFCKQGQIPHSVKQGKKALLKYIHFSTSFHTFLQLKL